MIWFANASRDSATFPDVPEAARLNWQHVLRLGVWAGLVTGVSEGVLGLMLQRLGRPIRVPVEILWISSVFNLMLFVTAAFVLTIAGRAMPSAWKARLTVLILLWMLAFGLVQVPQILQPGAALLLSLGAALAATRATRAVGWWLTLARRSVGWLAGAAAVAALIGVVWSPLQEWLALRSLPPPGQNQPNVILITLDTLRADHVSAYGYGRDTTPNLDRLAETGVLFEHAFSNASWTLPAHASLLTGRYPHEHQADWLQPMADDIPTLPAVLSQAGYQTAAFAANTSYVAPEWGLGRGFSRFDVYGGSIAEDIVRTNYGHRLALNLLPRVKMFDIPGRKRAAALNADFLAWLDDVKPGQPFFALINYFDVHDPYLTVQPYQDRYSPSPARGDLINFQFQPHAFRLKPTLDAAEVQAEIDAYDGCLSYMDAMLGSLLQDLSRRGLTGKTLVVIASDHGESFGTHDLFGHGNSLYLETLHVPLIIAWPDRLPAGRRVTVPVGLDRLPITIANLAAGARPIPLFPGQSLEALWNDAGTASGPEVDGILSEVSRVDGGPPAYPTSRASLTSFISDRWHLILADDQPAALYAWREDRQERKNLAGQPDAPATIEALRARMRPLVERRAR